MTTNNAEVRNRSGILLGTFDNIDEARNWILNHNREEVFSGGELDGIIATAPAETRAAKNAVSYENYLTSKPSPENTYRLLDYRAMQDPANPYDAAKGWISLNLATLAGVPAATTANIWGPLAAKYVVAPELAARVWNNMQQSITGLTTSNWLSNYLKNKGVNDMVADVAGDAVNPGYWVNFGAGKYTVPMFNKIIRRPFRHRIKSSEYTSEFVPSYTHESTEANLVIPRTKFVLGELLDDGRNLITRLDLRNLNGSVGQYARYYFRPSRFRGAQLPTVYRKFIYDVPTGQGLPLISRGKILLSNPESRFINSDNRVINWTNVTTDVPVRNHGNNDWDTGFTIAIPGKSILRKRVISTEPSDTFFPNKLRASIKKATVLSGDPKIQAWAKNNRLRTIIDENLNNAYNNAINSPSLDFSNVALVERKVARNTFGSPTKLDYDFMDYVFRPKYNSNVHPPFYIKGRNINQIPEWYGELYGDSKTRKILTNPKEWGNVMYDPFTQVELNYTDLEGITVLPFTDLNK